MPDDRLASDRFPRASGYHPDWVLAGVSGGANPLWLAEWLCEALDLRPGSRVLDLGCGRALSSVFLHREFGVQVWGVDLWFDPAENLSRVRDAGADGGVFPMRADARALPFADGFFDAVVAIDSYMYFGTDDLYLRYLARFLKDGGQLGIAMAGLIEELPDEVPLHLSEWWAAENPSCLHSAPWWRRQLDRSGSIEVTLADTLPDGWRCWREWNRVTARDSGVEAWALESDAGRTLGYVRAVGRRRPGGEFIDPRFAVPADYRPAPLRRDAATARGVTPSGGP